MKNLLLLAVLVSLPLLLGGCGEKIDKAPVNTNLWYENLKYEIKDDTVTITGCEYGTSGKLVIPANIEGKLVTRIGGVAFDACKNLTSITIPNSVTSIGDYAFTSCSSLTDIAIPDSVTSIGHYAFYDCTSLTSITIPDSVTSIGDYAFSACKNLTSITISDSLTSIGASAISFCTSLTAVTFLGDAPKIASDAFGDFTPTTIYRKPEAKGWGDTFGGRPVKLISEKP